MTPRVLLTTIGATALGFGLVISGAPAIPDVFAQEATPPAAVAPAQTEQEIDSETQRAQAYDSFVAALASELGSDEAAVDAAIRTALTQQVDEREAASDLDTERAAAMRAVIEVSDAPLFLGFGGRGGMHGFDGRGWRHGYSDRDGIGDRGLPGVDESPAGLPVLTTPRTRARRLRWRRRRVLLSVRSVLGGEGPQRPSPGDLGMEE